MRTRFMCGVFAIASFIGAVGACGLDAAVVVVQGNSNLGTSYVLDNNSDPKALFIYPTLGVTNTNFYGTTSAVKLTAANNTVQASNEYLGRVAATDESGSNWFATKFTAGELIEATDFKSGGVIQYLFLPGGGLHNQFTLGGQPSYIGFSYEDGARQAHYGWARVSIRDIYNDPVLHNYEITLYEWAYETTANLAIAAGSHASLIPEPSADAAWAGVGVMGFFWLRRKKKR